MTAHGFKASFKYQIFRMRFVPLGVALVYAAMILMVLFVDFTMDKRISLKNVEFFGTDVFCAVAMAIYAMIFSADFYNAGTANGVSRKTTLTASAAALFVMSAASALTHSVINAIVELLTGNDQIFVMEVWYGQRNIYLYDIDRITVFRARMLVITVFLFMFFAAFGFAAGSVLYRLPTKASVILILAVTIGMPNAAVAIENYSERHGIDVQYLLINAIGHIIKFFGMSVVGEGNIVKGIFAMLLCSAVFFAIALLFARRAAAKPAVIRGE